MSASGRGPFGPCGLQRLSFKKAHHLEFTCCLLRSLLKFVADVVVYTSTRGLWYLKGFFFGYVLFGLCISVAGFVLAELVAVLVSSKVQDFVLTCLRESFLLFIIDRVLRAILGFVDCVFLDLFGSSFEEPFIFVKSIVLRLFGEDLVTPSTSLLEESLGTPLPTFSLLCVSDPRYFVFVFVFTRKKIVFTRFGKYPPS